MDPGRWTENKSIARTLPSVLSVIALFMFHANLRASESLDQIREDPELKERADQANRNYEESKKNLEELKDDIQRDEREYERWLADLEMGGYMGERQKHLPEVTREESQRYREIFSKMLADMPEKLSPDNGVWDDELTLPKVQEWSTGKMLGKELTTQGYLTAMEVKYLGNDKYQVKLEYSFTPPCSELFFRNTPVLVGAVGAGMGNFLGSLCKPDSISVTVEGPEELAKQWKATPVGRANTVGLRGQINEVKWEHPKSYWMWSRGKRESIDNMKKVYVCRLVIAAWGVEDPKSIVPGAKQGVPEKDEPASDVGLFSVDQARVALSRLSLAKSYLSNGMRAEAKVILLEVTSKYPGTKPAEEAQLLLRGLEEKATENNRTVKTGTDVPKKTPPKDK